MVYDIVVLVLIVGITVAAAVLDRGRSQARRRAATRVPDDRSEPRD